MDNNLRKTLSRVAGFYDEKKVGDVGSLGFRRSTDLSKLLACLDELVDRDILMLGKSSFLDMGCADGRVNVLFSYLMKNSVGIELDEWTLEEYVPLKEELEGVLRNDNLLFPPDNISLFHGDSMDSRIHGEIKKETSLGFKKFDLFYTYLTMQEEFAGLIARKAKKGAVFMIYGLEKILPRFDGLTLLTPKRPLQGILALYRKI